MKKDNIFKDIWKLLHSMKFGIILLIIIGVSSIAGTLIPQDNIIGFYESTYGPTFFKIIKTFSLHKVYSSWWFITMVLVLSLNLTLCSIKRLPSILKKMKRKPNLDQELKSKDFTFERELDSELDIDKLFKNSKFKKIEKKDNDDGTFYFAQKNSIGHIGSWITHIGLLIIIIAYVFGKMTGFEAFVHGVPGSIQPVEGTDYWIEIEDFDIEFREDNTVSQYLSEIKITDNEGDYSERGDVKVNHPFRAKNMNIYQNGTGWALDVALKKNNEDYSSKILYQSEVYVEDDKNIALHFVNFYPDYDDSHGQPQTLTPYLNNPKLLYSIFYEGQRVAMNVADMGDEIVWEEYSFTIDSPQMFTLLQVGSDPGMKAAGAGGVLLVLGVFLAFYINPKELKVFRYKDGSTKIWADSSKNEDIFKSEMDLALNKSLEEGL